MEAADGEHRTVQSAERGTEKPGQLTEHQHGHFPSEDQRIDHNLDLNDLQWHSNVPLSALAVCNGTRQNFPVNDELLWQGHTIQVDSMVSLEPMQSLPIYESEQELRKETLCGKSAGPLQIQSKGKLQAKGKRSLNGDGSNLKCTKKIRCSQGKGGKKKETTLQVINIDTSISSKKQFNKLACVQSSQNSSKIHVDPSNSTVLEENSMQVHDRFLQGCECQDANCFDGLNPDNVFRHRLNIAELTKEEHDMYLMGLTMACLTDREQTNRKKERQRLRANYVYQGRPVCLQAFLYLENCTCYQVKRIRKHVITHGVVPRIHGNHGKRPHNTFSLDIYRHATEFLKMFVREKGQVKDCQNKTVPIVLGADITRKYVHQEYIKYCHENASGAKMMSYSTFRHFMKEQFPHIRFRHLDGPSVPRDMSNKQQQQNISNRASLRSPGYHPSPSLQEGFSSHPNSKVVQYASCQQDQQTITVSEETATDAQEMEFVEQSMSEVQCPTESEAGVSSNRNILVIDALPMISNHNFISTQSELPSTTSGAKVFTLNSSSLRFLSSKSRTQPDSRSVSPGALVAVNSITMLGSSVVPFIIDSGVSMVPCQKSFEEPEGESGDQFMEQNSAQEQEEQSHEGQAQGENQQDCEQKTPNALSENTSSASNTLDSNILSIPPFPFAVPL